MDAEGPTTTCVVLLREGASLSAATRAELAQRAWTIVVRHDPLETMTDLCLRHHRRAAPAPALATALLVADGADWPQATRVVDATRRYLPEVAMLRVDAHGRIDEDATRGASSSGPTGGDSHHGDPLANAEHADDVDVASTRLTRAEIDMLLQMPPGGS